MDRCMDKINGLESTSEMVVLQISWIAFSILLGDVMGILLRLLMFL